MHVHQDQATELRRMMTRLNDAPVGESVRESLPMGGPARSSARVIAVTSGKGGVGKTNVSVNLAVRLAKMGRRVALLDADLGLANADVICNVTARTNLAHVVAGRRDLREAIIATPGGFDLLPGASGLTQMASLSEFERTRIIDMLRRLDAEYDLMLIDTGAGIGPNVMTFLSAADEVLVVTTPEPTAVTDAYALIKTLTRRREAVVVSVLVNMVKDRAEGRRVFERINAVSRRFLGLSLSDAGHVVSDGRVTGAVRRRQPFVLDAPDCPASLCLTQLAHKLDRHAMEPRGQGFFRRMASWLAS